MISTKIVKSTYNNDNNNNESNNNNNNESNNNKNGSFISTLKNRVTITMFFNRNLQLSCQ